MIKKLTLAVLATLSTAALADINVGVSVAATGPAASLGIPEKNTFALLPTTIGGQKAVIKDPDVTRYRPRIIIAEDVTTVAGASKRGQWQKQRSIGEGTQTEITVAGWRTQGMEGSTGPLWRINRMCPIKDEIQGLDESWLIVTVTLMEDDKNGREAIINLTPREAMLIPAEVVKKQTKEVTTW